MLLKFTSLLGFLAVASATDCVGVIRSLTDVAANQNCSTVNIYGFTVPPGQPFNINLAQGATVNLKGDIHFGNLSWAGPMFTISGKNIIFKGNGHIFNGGGPFYWDGLGSNGGTIKPRPMMKIKISGRFTNVKVVNSPAQTFSVGNPGPLTISGVYIDNSQGDRPNAQSNGLPAGHNTDGFDCSTMDLAIEDCNVKNQDDCLAINKGSNITFTNNQCRGGHGISIGSISANVSVSNIVISNNVITDNDQALRIKMKVDATNSTVTNITYSGNTASGCRDFGVLIDQSYPSILAAPGSGVLLSDVNFVGKTNVIHVNNDADRVAVNCGAGACLGTWDWSSLKVTGGIPGPVTYNGISGYIQ
ncbi:endo-polygalacturonase PG1 [Rickenella mellea]|uniref:endo-polygalacturonase n=1 Tax=Rickenella mellea TaxID=50990 RepID=A0A4Y7QAM4_9AGAM|nr:endo-polygalacturonase PG1 [Rickenella mellea]